MKLYPLFATLLISTGLIATVSAKNLVEVAASSAEHTTLVSALTAAGLTETLGGEGPYTLFAPTNAAFEKLPPGTLESLLRPENKGKLVAILTYHVLAQQLLIADVKTGNVPALNSKPLAIFTTDEGITVNGAKVTATDKIADNGVVHFLDTVLIP